MNDMVAVMGVGNTPFKARHIDKTFPRLAYESVKAALEDAGATKEDIGSTVYAIYNDFFEHCAMPDLHIHYQLGLARKPGSRITCGGATGGYAVRAAVAEVASGMHDVVMVVGVEKVGDVANVFDMVKSITYAADPFFEASLGASPAGSYGGAILWHMENYGTTEEDMARVVVKNKGNARNNPDAQSPMEVTVEDVLGSPLIIYPLKILDHCLNSEGAATIILASEKAVGRFSSDPVWITGVGASTESGRQAERDDAGKSLFPAVRASALEAYEMAGVADPGSAIQVAEVYDSFSGVEICLYEEFGLCGWGEGVQFLTDGRADMGGSNPVNPSGGLIGGEHAIGATGVYQVVEIVRQIRGEAGARQVPHVTRGLAQSMGGARGAYSVSIVVEG
ncbi:MAG: thiolase family protein [Actinobacteria bacterium]|nr:thiolase family protein [Actinomycetota bacterium]